MSCWCCFPSWGLLKGRVSSIWVTEKQSTNTGKVSQLPLFFPKGQGLAEQGSALAEGTLVWPCCEGRLFWELLEMFGGFWFGWFCIGFLFFSPKRKVLFWIQLLLHLNLQLPGFSRKHGSFGLHFRITYLGGFLFKVPRICRSHWTDCSSLVTLCFSDHATFNTCSLRSTFHCVSCFWLSTVESCTLWELFAVDDISSGNCNCTWIMWNDCLPL